MVNVLPNYIFHNKNNSKYYILALNIFILLPFVRWQFGLLLFHTLVEFYTIVISVLMLVVVINTKKLTNNEFLVFIGIGYFSVGLLDTFHILSIKGMPFFPETSIQTTVHFWVYARFFETLTLLFAPIFLHRRVDIKLSILITISIVILISCLSFFFVNPIFINNEGLTDLKINSEYFIIALLVISLLIYQYNKQYFSKRVLLNMSAAIVFTILAEYSFTFFFNFQSTAFVIGHLFKFISFWLIYQAIIDTTFKQPFKQLNKTYNSFNVLPHPAITVDEKGNICQLNNAASKSIDANSNIIIGQPVHEYFHPNELTPSQCYLCCQADKGNTVTEKQIFFSKRQRWYQISTQLLYEQSVNVKIHPSYVLVLIDITDQKNDLALLNRALEALRNTEKTARLGSWKYEVIDQKLTCSDEIFTLLDISKNTSPSLYKYFYKRVQSDYGTKFKEYCSFYLNLIACSNSAAAINIDENGSKQITLKIRDKQHKIKYLFLETSIVLDAKNHLVNIEGHIQDVTERRQMTEALHRTEKLDALGKLTGGIAHDFNNILGVILGFGELLRNDLSSSSKQSGYVKNIITAGNRGASLTKKLLTYSKEKQKNINLININTLIEESEDLLTRTLTANTTLVLSLSSDLYLTRIDENAFNDILLNLCINANHAMQHKGLLTISTKNEHLSQEESKVLGVSCGNYIKLSIEDNGCGMDDETKQRIFEPFYTTKKDIGTGLGLFQVYTFITANNGAIKVYSELNVGSRFVLYFPSFNNELTINNTNNTHDNNLIKPDKHSTAVDLKISSPKTILVVDDEIQLLNLATTILENAGYYVLTACSAKEALQHLIKTPIDLLLSDIIMPEIDGFELAKSVAQLYPNTKILLVSGFAKNKSMDKSEFSGVILDKPYSPNDLLRAVKNALGRN